MHLTRLYGRKSVVFHDGRQNYAVKNGVVDLPAHLVQRAIDQGFSRTPFADLAVPDDRPVIDVPETPGGAIASIATSTTAQPDGPLTPPATQDSTLPPSHPQAAETKALATREQLRAAEQRIRDGGK